MVWGFPRARRPEPAGGNRDTGAALLVGPLLAAEAATVPLKGEQAQHRSPGFLGTKTSESEPVVKDH